MTEQSLKFQISQSNNDTLKAVYEHCCEEYRKRLCEQWGIMPSSATWHDPLCEGYLCIDFVSCIVLNMSEVRLLVENYIRLDDFVRYWDYERKTEKGVINMKDWFLKGVRPKDYEKEIQNK